MSFHGDHHRSSSGQGRRRGPNDGSSQPFDAQAFGAHPFSMMMGGGGLAGGSSIFDDFFGRSNPFDDPFFQRPMGMMGMFGGSMFGRTPSAMGVDSFFDRSGFFSPSSHGAFLEQHPVNLPTQAQPVSSCFSFLLFSPFPLLNFFRYKLIVIFPFSESIALSICFLQTICLICDHAIVRG